MNQSVPAQRGLEGRPPTPPRRPGGPVWARKTVRAFLFDAGGRDREVDLAECPPGQLSDRQLLWVDVSGGSPDDLARLGELLELHRESLRNLLSPVGRPRLDLFEHYYQVNVAAVRPGRDGRDFQAVPLDFFAGRNYVVTVHPEPLPFLEDFSAQARQGGDLGRLGALDSASFLAALLDWHVGEYFRALEALEDAVDRLDEQVLRRTEERGVLERLVALRRRAGDLRRLLAPHREVFAALSRPDFEAIALTPSGPRFRALADRLERAVDAVEGARELVLGSFDLYMTRTAQRTNDVVRLLTVITLLVGAAGVVAGALGMNFDLPIFKQGERGFLEALAGMGSLALVVLFVARLARWI